MHTVLFNFIFGHHFFLNREYFKISVMTFFNKIRIKLRKLGAFDYFEHQPTLK